MDFSFQLIFPVFFAGVLTFFAPCTLPILPAYLGFISGVSTAELQDPSKFGEARRKILKNALLFVLGFIFVFVALGTLFGAFGVLLAKYRMVLNKLAGVFVILFGLTLVHAIELPFLNKERRMRLASGFQKNSTWSSLGLGLSFGLGWTPCIGPIVGSVLFLASTSQTFWQGSFLLFVFGIGLAVPFLLLAWGIRSAAEYMRKFEWLLPYVSTLGGLLLIVLGLLLLTDSFGAWVGYLYSIFNAEWFLDYL